MPTQELPLIDKLNTALKHLKNTFVGKDDIIDLMGIGLVSRENMFMLGPPGTAKSALVRELAKVLHGKTFEYLLTRFTEPNELFGPFDIRKLREGELVTNTEGMLPEANLIFLDELLNANSAILNSLLLVLNEKIFRRGRENRALPAVMIVGASNQLPEDEALQALFDRFLIRVRCENVDTTQLSHVLDAGWRMEAQGTPDDIQLSNDEIFHLQALITTVDLTAIRPAYIELVQKLRNAGVQLSDRRAVKLQRLVAASALICKRTQATHSDLWVFRHIWDTLEQEEIISGIVNTVVNTDTSAVSHHPRATTQSAPDADAIFHEVTDMLQRWDDPNVSMADRAIMRDRLRYLNGRCEWITNSVQRAYVQEPIDTLWRKILAQA